jgi:AcrR family transcriptional regulator
LERSEKDGARNALIVDQAIGKFRRFGIRRVSMDEIAGGMRISKKTLYRHFPDKRSLVMACAERLMSEVLPEVKRTLDSDAPPVERLTLASRAFATLPQKISPEFMADVQADYPGVWREIDRRRRTVIAGFERLLSDGVANGDVHPGIHPGVAFRILMAAVERVMVPEVLAAGEFTPAQAVGTLLTMFTRGVFLNPPGSDPVSDLSAGRVQAAPRSRPRKPRR